LTLEQMRARRIHGASLLARGVRAAAVARELGVTRQSVMRWARALERGGLELVGQLRRPGARSQLSAEQLRQLLERLKRGARAAGFANDNWTLRRVGIIIRQHFDVTLSTSSVWRTLRRIGWSDQRRSSHATYQTQHSAESGGNGARG